MKTCLVVCDLPVQYRVLNFSVQNLKLIEDSWDRIKKATETAVDLVNTFGIDRDNLTSANAIIPIIYFLSVRPELKPRGTSTYDVTNSGKINRWLLAALLNRAFGGTSDNLLTDIRSTLTSSVSTEGDFPLDLVNETIARSGRKAAFDDIAIDDFLSITYGKQETFLALSILYDEHNWGTVAFHQDHIFPRDLFSTSKMDEAGIPHEKQASYLSMRDRIGNLELLLSAENEEKSNQNFAQWLTTRDISFRKKHHIPDDPDLYSFGKFDQLVSAREKLIRDYLSKLFRQPETTTLAAAVPSD